MTCCTSAINWLDVLYNSVRKTPGGVVDLRDLKIWRRDGCIELPSATFKGIENATPALQEACAGRHRGVVLIEL